MLKKIFRLAIDFKVKKKWTLSNLITTLSRVSMHEISNCFLIKVCQHWKYKLFSGHECL